MSNILDLFATHVFIFFIYNRAAVSVYSLCHWLLIPFSFKLSDKNKILKKNSSKSVSLVG